MRSRPSTRRSSAPSTATRRASRPTWWRRSWARGRAAGEPLEIAFLGQAVERKGLPVLLRAFEALRAHVPARLTVVGASAPEVAPLLVDQTGVTVLGRVSDEEKRA